VAHQANQHPPQHNRPALRTTGMGKQEMRLLALLSLLRSKSLSRSIKPSKLKLELIILVDHYNLY
jgi:hypothetical protein